MRYLIILLNSANGKPLYAVVDKKKFFTSKRKALQECRRLNEVEDSIQRAFSMAAEDRRKEQEK